MAASFWLGPAHCGAIAASRTRNGCENQAAAPLQGATTGERDLQLDQVAPDLPSMSRYVRRDYAQADARDGVRTRCLHLATQGPRMSGQTTDRLHKNGSGRRATPDGV